MSTPAILKKRSLRDTELFDKYPFEESAFRKRRVFKNESLEIAKTSNLEKFSQMFERLDYNVRLIVPANHC